ncbi:MAG: hypothetical protein MRJ65_03275 [Candidatus Brocadiaceae bacterium]|nr:hypothetical protein [Candidatus Brocadiaceae bacterium]
MENIPLLLTGGLRGIAVDFLWARAMVRHREKKYYELLTINNLIAKLQPNFPAVWIFQAWNMAYNVAHEWDSPQNKWKWIRTGLHFAKKGTEKNPTSGDLFFELGYMYSHLFDKRFFKYADYYRKQLKDIEGVDNYEASLFWLRKSLLHNPVLRNVLAIERTICHTLWHAALCAEEEGEYQKALQYIKSSIDEWEAYRENHPEDTATNVRQFITTLEKKEEFLQHLLKGDIWQ